MFAKSVELRCDYRTNPLGIDDEKPSLSWRSDSKARDWKQSAYQVLVSTNAEGLRRGTADVWDSGKISSAESIGISYGGPALESGHRYYWAVRTWDAKRNESQSTEEAWWEMDCSDSARLESEVDFLAKSQMPPMKPASVGFGSPVRMRSRKAEDEGNLPFRFFARIDAPKSRAVPDRTRRLAGEGKWARGGREAALE